MSPPSSSPDYTSYTHFNITFPSPYTAQVELNRPQKLNAFHPPMWYECGQIFNTLSHDPNIRAIVLTGAGDRAFTAGLDVQAASSGPIGDNNNPNGPDVARKATDLRRHIADYQAQITAIEKCEKPVIVVLHGVSYGLAVDISTACDIRLCTKDVRLCVKEVDIGLAADVGTLSRLPKANVSFSWIKDVCLTAREFGAEEALRQGFVSGVYEGKKEALERAHEIARLIATKSPVAVQSTKEVLNFARDHTVQEGLDYVKVWNMAMLQTKDVSDSMLAGLQKRKPTFEKL